MLLKRLDVTLQSFLWADRAVGREGEIAAAIQSQRSTLSETPKSFSMQDALQAPASLIAECSERVTQSHAGILNRSLVKSVLIGPVPDRGGRASALRTKISDKPKFKNNRGGRKGQSKPSSEPMNEAKMEVSNGGETQTAEEDSSKGEKREGGHHRARARHKKKQNK